MKYVHLLAIILLVIGGLNWGAIGLFQYNAVEVLLATMPMVIKAVYVLVGVSAVYIGVTSFTKHE